MIISVAALLFVASLSNTNAFQGRSSRTFAVLAVVLVASLPFASWLNRLSFKNAFSKGQEGQQPKLIEVEISERGLLDAGTSFRQNWKEFSKYAESRTAFILYKGNVIETIIPKRALDSKSLENLREVLQRNFTQN